MITALTLVVAAMLGAGPAPAPAPAGNPYTGKLVLLAGGGTADAGKAPTECRLREPFGTAVDSKGRLYIIEMAQGERLLRVEADGTLAVLAGDGKKGAEGDGGPAAKARFNGAHALCIGPDDAVYIADTWNNTIRRIDPATGVITTIAGTGKKGFAGDGGPAVKAEFSGSFSVAIDAAGTRLCVADLGNRRVRVIDLKSGVVTTAAGNGAKGVPTDGAKAVEAPLADPRAACWDAKGNLYVLERGGNALRVVDTDGKIRTVVNTSGKPGGTGDGGPGLAATTTGPKHLCCDAAGNVLIADAESQLVRVWVPSTGVIHRVAGTGKKGSAGVGGPATEVQLARPHGVTVRPDGKLIITDSYNDRILLLEPATGGAK